MTRDGRKRNGCLRYHIQPIQMSIDQLYEHQLSQPEENAARQEADARLSRLCAAQEASKAETNPTTPPTV